MQVYAKSRLQDNGEPGDSLLEALGGGGAVWARRKRPEAGVAPDPELEHVGKAPGDQYRCCSAHCTGLSAASIQESSYDRIHAGTLLSLKAAKPHCRACEQSAEVRRVPSCRFYQDGSYAPAEREVYDQQLAAFYESHGAVQASTRAASALVPPLVLYYDDWHC